jgi:hypothetical protein
VGFLKQSAMTVAAIGAAGAIVAGGTIPAPAATTSGVRYRAVQSITVSGGSGTTSCVATVLSAAVSTGNPAYVSAMVTNTSADACTGWLQNSVNGGAWTDVSPKQSVPGGRRLPFSNARWYKTANYYAGPGTRIRACLQVSMLGEPPRCSAPVSLTESTATPASDGTSVYYTRRQQLVSKITGDSQCAAWLNSSTKHKASTTYVSMTLQGLAVAPTCTRGWLESSTNNGLTWEHATPTYSLNILSGLEYAFSPAVADGTGHLVRACVKGRAAKKCSAAW